MRKLRGAADSGAERHAPRQALSGRHTGEVGLLPNMQQLFLVLRRAERGRGAEMTCIGIDPGKSGALAVIDGGSIQVAKFDEGAYIAQLNQYEGLTAVCCLEHVSAMPGQGVT